MKFKFRAECEADLEQLMATAGTSITILQVSQAAGFPDVDVVIETDIRYTDLCDILRAVPDGHVMLQTLWTEREYTGERNYDLE
jgi:hypothetical protein